ncbi:BRO family protein [Comamonas sp.]|uniref:BRO-N domain-containing protein n=1 Tax=Comamonas sp. TaxID=34028 RepID=UPI0025852479|nr:BRO family protein [Comamonas sp.]
MANPVTNRASALSFRTTQFEIVDQQGQHWLKASDLARALGYAREDAVSRIYERNAAEFREDMTLTVKLTVNGINDSKREKEVRIFSLRGAHLLAMFARTSVAKEFRVWVLDVLEHQHGTPQPQPLAQRTERAHLLASKATAQVFDTVFQAAMRDDFHPVLDRILLSLHPTDDAVPQALLLERNAIVTTVPHLIHAVASDLHISTADLTHLALACTQRLAARTPSASQQGHLQLR